MTSFFSDFSYSSKINVNQCLCGWKEIKLMLRYTSVSSIKYTQCVINGLKHALTDYCINTLNSSWILFHLIVEYILLVICAYFYKGTFLNAWLLLEWSIISPSSYCQFYLDRNTSYNTVRVGLHCFFHPLSIFFPQGSRCNEPCLKGLWGRHCNQSCFTHCPNSDTCLRETGACVCRSGYWGDTCQNSECCCQPAKIRSDQDQKCTGLTV